MDLGLGACIEVEPLCRVRVVHLKAVHLSRHKWVLVNYNLDGCVPVRGSLFSFWILHREYQHVSFEINGESYCRCRILRET